MNRVNGMRKKIVAIIPARMGASRFHGKPLAKILDLPMIEHVRRRVCLSAIDDVYVATCDQEIYSTVTAYGGKAIMTARTHERCTDRVEEAARHLDADIIAIIQGDEPLFLPDTLSVLTEPFNTDGSILCTNLLSIIDNEDDFIDEDVVKAVLNIKNNIVYYSRSPIPFQRVKNQCDRYRQTGISAFTKEFLHQFTRLSATPKEITESIDFLRIIEHGYPVRGVIYPQRTIGVDRIDDISPVEKILREDATQQALYQRILNV